MRILKANLFDQLPAEWPESLINEIRVAIERTGKKIVVLDDDPTGTQTVYDTPVLTRWEVDDLVSVFRQSRALVYILTNTRSLPLDQAEALNREITRNLIKARQQTGREFDIISRSDSTLRGHYPGEVNAILETLGRKDDCCLVIPFFQEGGRFTIHDIHYVEQENFLVPAAETEYAHDGTFGYQSSNLKQWVSEKQGGRILPENVTSISLNTIRKFGPEGVMNELIKMSPGSVGIVNAVSYRDIEVFVAGVLKAEAIGKRFCFRTAASFVRVRSGLPVRSLLTTQDFKKEKTKYGGLIIAGSYIQRSTEQIEALKNTYTSAQLAVIEVDVSSLLDPIIRPKTIEKAWKAADAALKRGKNVLIFTSRRLVTAKDGESNLLIGSSVSASLVEIVRRINVHPAWIVAKGGITASDIATQGLGIVCAEVIGQILPGVPVWRTGFDARWNGLLYVVFPGNVGSPKAIVHVVQLLSN
jgi:uncharacterized protein YgbK (DUF1537 family)